MPIQIKFPRKKARVVQWFTKIPCDCEEYELGFKPRWILYHGEIHCQFCGGLIPKSRYFKTE